MSEDWSETRKRVLDILGPRVDGEDYGGFETEPTLPELDARLLARMELEERVNEIRSLVVVHRRLRSVLDEAITQLLRVDQQLIGLQDEYFQMAEEYMRGQP